MAVKRLTPPTAMMVSLAAALRDAARRALIFVARDATGSVGQRHLLVVAPHPDDETLGCGARILLNSRLGTPVTIVVVTDGSGSHGEDDAGRGELRVRRRAELDQAARILGVRDESVIALDYPDYAVADHADQVTADLRRVIDEARPDDVYVTCVTELHPDHAACAVAAIRAVNEAALRPRLLEYPIWLWSDWPISRRQGGAGALAFLSCLLRRSVEVVRIGPLAPEKLRALDAYRSQLGEQPLTARAAGYAIEPDEVALPPVVVRRALAGPEMFFTRRMSRVAGASKHSEPTPRVGILPRIRIVLMNVISLQQRST